MAQIATTCVECGVKGTTDGPEGMIHKTIVCERCEKPKEPGIILDAETCPHEEFLATVNIDRITDGDHERPNVVLGFYACIRIICLECNTPFHFKGLRYGLTPTEPRVEVGGLEARMPVGPGRLPLESFGTADYVAMSPKE